MDTIIITFKKNRQLIISFVAYLLLIPCFAVLYFVAYQNNIANFSFNSDILKAQENSFKLTVANDEAVLNAFQTLHSELDKGTKFSEGEEGYDIKSGGYKYVLYSTIIPDIVSNNNTS